MRARVLIGTVAGVLALTTGVALAETSPADPEVVEPIDDVGPTTTTTSELPPVEEPTTTTTTSTTVVAPEEPTTTTTTAVVDEPDVVDPVDVVEPVDAVEEPVADERPQNHGYFVSQAAHDRSGEGGNHGASVSAVARSDAGKPRKG
jgi:hypothetical protein